MHRPANHAHQNPPPQPKPEKSQKKKKKAAPKPEPVPTPSRDMTLADVANLALTLEIDNGYGTPDINVSKQVNQEKGLIFDNKTSYGGMESNHIRSMSNEVRNFSAYAQGEVPPPSPFLPHLKTLNENLIQPFVAYLQHLVKHLIWDPEVPEFTSLQQFNWAVMIGVFMGVFTALWSMVIEFLVDKFWVELPELLMEWGLFTDLDGFLPLPHYMWICPAIFGAVS